MKKIACKGQVSVNEFVKLVNILIAAGLEHGFLLACAVGLDHDASCLWRLEHLLGIGLAVSTSDLQFALDRVAHCRRRADLERKRRVAAQLDLLIAAAKCEECWDCWLQAGCPSSPHDLQLTLLTATRRLVDSFASERTRSCIYTIATTTFPGS